MKTKILLFSLLLSFNSLIQAQDIITLGAADPIGTALSAYTGNNVVLIIPAGYTNPQGTTAISIPVLTAGAKITFRGDGSKPELKIKGLTLPTGLNVSAIKFEGLTLSGATTDPTANYVINVAAGIAVTIDSLIFNGCNISTFRSLLRFQSTTATPDQIANNFVLNNCILNNCSDYGVVYNNKVGGLFGAIVAKKSTFYGYGQNVFMCQTNTASVSISDCTFDNIVSTSTGKYIVDLNAQASPITVTNSIFGGTILAAKGFRTGGTMSITNCYRTTNSTGSDSIKAPGGVTGAIIAYAGTSAQLFKSPNTSTPGTAFVSTADYSIIDATFAGKTSAGDPRWYPSTGLKNNSINSFKVFPNPTTDIIYFEKTVSKVEIIDLLGKIVKSQNNVSESNLKSLSAGTYLVRAYDADGNISVQKVNRK